MQTFKVQRTDRRTRVQYNAFTPDYRHRGITENKNAFFFSVRVCVCEVMSHLLQRKWLTQNDSSDSKEQKNSLRFNEVDYVYYCFCFVLC